MINCQKNVLKTWDKVRNSELIYNEKYLKTKINQHSFSWWWMPKEGSSYICLSVILIHSFFKMGKNYYP